MDFSQALNHEVSVYPSTTMVYFEMLQHQVWLFRFLGLTTTKITTKYRLRDWHKGLFFRRSLIPMSTSLEQSHPVSRVT